MYGIKLFIIFSMRNIIVGCSDGEVAIELTSISPDESVVVPKICFDSSWKTVCDWNWSYSDATVACRHSGASSYGRFQIT